MMCCDVVLFVFFFADLHVVPMTENLTTSTVKNGVSLRIVVRRAIDIF